MILLPNKTTRPQYSLLGVGAQIIQYMSGPETLTSLWSKVQGLDTVNTYEKFISSLVLLYTLKAIHIKEGLLYKNDY